MKNEKVKIRNKKTGAIKEIKKTLAGDYIGTGDFVLIEENKKANSIKDLKKWDC
jgi:hypothetical protein